MAATFDAASAPAAVTAASLTFSHTCSGTNRGLVVGVGTSLSTGATGVTYNGVAMALEVTLLIPTVNFTVEIWKLEAPASGTNNVVVTCATSRDIAASGISVLGADQTDCSLANASAQGTGTTPSVAVTSVAGDLVVSYCVSDATTHAPGANETERADVTSPAVEFQASSTTESPAGASATMSRTLGASTTWGIVAVSCRAAGGGPAPFALAEDGIAFQPITTTRVLSAVGG